MYESPGDVVFGGGHEASRPALPRPADELLYDPAAPAPYTSAGRITKVRAPSAPSTVSSTAGLQASIGVGSSIGVSSSASPTPSGVLPI